jgi:transmembrane sensor
LADEAVATQAIEWLEINRDGTASGAIRAEFLLWLQRSPVNVEHYLRAAAVASTLRSALASRTESTQEVISQSEREDPAVVLLELGPAPPSVESRSAATRRRSTRDWLKVTSLAAALLASVLLLLPELASDGRIGFPVAYKTLHTEQGSWRLPDGSMLHLNSDSRAIVWYSRKERYIELLRGQAMFHVAHQKNRRFRVEAGTAQIVSVGTQFDVLRGDSGTRVVVREGKVKVMPASQELGGNTAMALPGALVESGRAVVIDTNGVSRELPGNILQATAWLQREIVFQHSPLENVVKDFNKYSELPIVIDSEELESLSISGVFSAYDLESFIQFLDALDNVDVEVQKNKIRIFVVKPALDQSMMVDTAGNQRSKSTQK